jgi:hypothetical protein
MPVLAAADLQLFLLSAVVPNDQLLLFGFDGVPAPRAAVDQLTRNARACPDLGLRVSDAAHRARWVPGAVTADQVLVHPRSPWPQCLAAVADLPPLDATRAAWRAHLFPPGVLVVQIAHALGDGGRSSALAAALLGRGVPPPQVAPVSRGFLPARSVAAARAHRRLVADTAAGRLPAPAGERPALSVNARPGGPGTLRTLVVGRERLRLPTVTVGALAAVGEALGGYLTDRGEDVSRLGAEVPMAAAGPPLARNHFRSVGVGLHPELDPESRATRIARELAGQRRRAEHPAVRASAEAFAAVPGRLLGWGVSRFDPSASRSTVAGNTVVSSVHRGPADLSLAGVPVRFTAGYPALSPMMSLTHGVHGIGDTVAVSIRADPANVDVDDYLERLARALDARD